MRCQLVNYSNTIRLLILRSLPVSTKRGAVLLPVRSYARVASCRSTINDSKKIGEKKREQLYEVIVKTALDYATAIIGCDEIDEINILNAAKKGMAECVRKLKLSPGIVLVDAIEIPGDFCKKAIIKGDATSYNIAAASIVAKVTRDRIMRDYDKAYPEYGFARNKGYGTKEHIEAIKKYGLCPIHRKSFVKNFLI